MPATYDPTPRSPNSGQSLSLPGRADLIGKTLSQFKIVDKIGEGGMGVVYRAEDQELHRPVALKVLQPDLVGSEESRARFVLEARTAAKIVHPNIAAIHQILEVEEGIFIAMEHVEGTPLNALIGGKPLPIERALDIAFQISDGLEAAHAARIIHRDLKPGNIHVTDKGRVKILDFGLAKPMDADEDLGTEETISHALTREGKIVGTVAYMSPEQARGQDIGVRSDIFSFGSTLYEMVTGRPPFKGQTASDTIAMILRDEPTAAAEINPEVPPELSRIIGKCMEKDPADRYQDAQDLCVDLRRLRRDTSSRSWPPATESVTLPKPLTPSGRGRRGTGRTVATVVGALAALAILVVFGSRLLQLTGGESNQSVVEPLGNSLAVMTIKNLTDTDDSQRLGLILQELIITGLSQLEDMKVLSSQRLHDIQKQLVGLDPDAPDEDVASQVAARAGVSTMLTGALSQLGTTYILTAQLIDVSKGTVLESQRIDGTDLYAMVDELTNRLREDLRVPVEVEPRLEISIRDRTTESLEAYRYYFAGVDLLNNQNYHAAADTLEAATRLDPRFGQAYYKRAMALWWGGAIDSAKEVLGHLLTTDINASEKDRKLAEAALKLLENDHATSISLYEEVTVEHPDEKEAWYGLGEARFHSGLTSESPLEPFQRAIELDPSFALAYRHILDLHYEEGRFKEAVELVEGLIQSDPENPLAYRFLADAAIRWGNEDEIQRAMTAAREHQRTTRELQRLLTMAAGAYRSREDHYSAKSLVLEARDLGMESLDVDWYRYAILILTDTGDLAQAESLVEEAMERYTERIETLMQPSFQLVLRLGDYDEAIDAARRSIEESPQNPLPYAGLAIASARAGKQDDTERIKDEVLSSSMSVGEKVHFLGHVSQDFLTREEYGSAVAWLEEASSLDPEGEHAVWMLPLAFTYARTGRLDEADALAQRLSATGQQIRFARFVRAITDLTRGDYVSVEESARDFIENGPAHVWAYKFLALALMEQGRHEEAVPFARKALAMDGNHLSYVILARALIEGDVNLEEGMELAEKARSDVPVKETERAWRFPQCSSAEHCLGAAYLKLGRYKDAVEALEEAALLYPDDPKIREDLARAQTQLQLQP
jgi:serine/threonine protein kinase/tetratricopeptide (TPR) repeat protein